MRILIVGTSHKPPGFFEELNAGRRYRLEYLDLSEYLGNAAIVDYDPPWMHEHRFIRTLEQKMHMDFYWSWKISQMVDQQGYDVVITMSERAAVPLGWMLSRRVRQIAILLNGLSPKWLKAIRLLGVQHRWERIIVYSRSEAEALRQVLHLEPHKVVTVLNYVDLGFFDPLKVEPVANVERPFIMSQGVAKRDYPTLIEAMRMLPHIECHISAVSAWDKYAGSQDSRPLPGNVVMKDYNHPFMIREAMMKCRFMVIPVQPDVGMWCSGSTSVMQGQAMGKPVIVTYLPGIAEYVVENETGFVVEGHNPARLAEKIDYLWKNPDIADEMGRKAQAWVRNNFSLQTWIEKVAQVVEDVERA
ncbi:MAG TPA: glycosyltransferase family 4 protein [Levilinea sp.]|nr:glycosyltransferase family 4 protein [Levilinea sp.]